MRQSVSVNGGLMDLDTSCPMIWLFGFAAQVLINAAWVNKVVYKLINTNNAKITSGDSDD